MDHSSEFNYFPVSSLSSSADYWILRYRNPKSHSPMRPKLFTVFIVLCLLSLPQLLHAFDFFSFFGNEEEHHGHQHSRQSGNRNGRGNSDGTRRNGNDPTCTSASNYLCPDTSTCVSSPKECPCPGDPYTIKKCAIGDWYICAADCNIVKQLNTEFGFSKAFMSGKDKEEL